MSLKAIELYRLSTSLPSPSDFLGRLIIGLKGQVADLALKVFIPINRLAPITPPSIVGRVSLDTFCPSRFMGNPLQFFEQSSDLNHLESILKILENGPLTPKKLTVLSRYFEALSVHGGALTDSHWTTDEDKMTLSVWSMLSYYTHCSTYFAKISPALLKLIDDHLLNAFQKDTPIFREIFEYERRKEERHYLTFELIELKIRKFHELQRERSIPDQVGFSAVANFSECKKLALVKNRRFLTQYEKIEWGEKIWEELSSQDPSAIDKVMQSREVIGMVHEIEGRHQEMERRKAQIVLKTQKGALNHVKREIQSLYEYEQLSVALDITQVIIDCPQQTPIEVWIQWLIIIRESFKVVVTDDTLNINSARSIHALSDMITKLRDYYEHPEDYVLRLSDPALKDENSKRKSLEKELLEELPKLSTQVKKVIEERLKKIKQLIVPHPQIDPNEALEGLAFRNSDKKRRDLAKEQFPKMAHFVSSITKQKGNHCQDTEVIKNLLESLHSLSTCIRSNWYSSSFQRETLETMLDGDLFFCLQVKREMSVAVRNFEQFMKIVKRCNFEKYTLLEECYYSLRDVRNFQTHDLWRTNVNGLTNAIYFLVFEITEIIMSLVDGRKEFSQGSLEDEIIDKVVFNKLDRKTLEDALEKGLDLQACDSKGRTLLHFLAEHPSENNLELAQLVISRGASIHWADCMQMRPLHYAAESGFTDLARYLVSEGAVVDASSRHGTPVEIAQNHENNELAQILASNSGIKRSTHAMALLDAVKNVDLDRIKRLASLGFDSGAEVEGKLPLVALFEIQEIDISQLLEIADTLLQTGASIDQPEPVTGQTVLHAACTSTDDPRVIQFLMERLSGVNCLDNNRQTPLHKAVLLNHENWVKALLKANASVDVYDNFGHTPLLSGCNVYGCSENIIDLLLQHGANPEAESEFGRVLHHMAERGTLHGVALLLNKGASPFIPGKGGLFSGKLPYEISHNTFITRIFLERMEYLFSHLLPEDQETYQKLVGLVTN